MKTLAQIKAERQKAEQLKAAQEHKKRLERLLRQFNPGSKMHATATRNLDTVNAKLKVLGAN